MVSNVLFCLLCRICVFVSPGIHGRCAGKNGRLKPTQPLQFTSCGLVIMEHCHFAVFFFSFFLHPAVPLKDHTFVYGYCRCRNIPEYPARGVYLNPDLRINIAANFSADADVRGLDIAFKQGRLPHNESAFSQDLSLETAIYTDRPGKRKLPFKFRVFAEKRINLILIFFHTTALLFS